MNRKDVLELFPNLTIKSVYVSLHNLTDYKQLLGSTELFTTPLHLAA